LQTHKWSWNGHKLGHGSRRGYKPRTTVLVRASSNLLDWKPVSWDVNTESVAVAGHCIWAPCVEATYPLTKPQGPASDVLYSFPKETMYEETIKAFEDRSGDNHLEAEYRRQLTTRTQHVGGSLQEFASTSNTGPPCLSCATRGPRMEESRYGIHRRRMKPRQKNTAVPGR
jgi:hypothetical protein